MGGSKVDSLHLYIPAARWPARSCGFIKGLRAGEPGHMAPPKSQSLPTRRMVSPSPPPPAACPGMERLQR